MTQKPINIPVVTENPGKDSATPFWNGLWRNNPIFVQVLGMCPTLAVTNSAINALTMGLATAFVLLMSSLLVSSLRHRIPHTVRIGTYILIIATFVTTADYLIQVISLDIHHALGPFVSLIVVNCIILGRAEAYASQHPPRLAIQDALGMGLGFAGALLVLGTIRELLGSGSLFGWRLLPASFEPWVIMLLPSGGFFTLGLLLIVLNWVRTKNQAGLSHE